MKRSEMMAYINAADGVSPTMKAAAIVGITMMSKKQFEEFSLLADRGLEFFKAADYDGLLRFLEDDAKAPPDVIETARSLIGAFTSASDPNKV